MAYAFYRTVTQDHTKVGVTDSSNFGMWVTGALSYLATVANGGLIQNTTTQTGGGASITVPADLKFTSDSAGNNLLKWEFETYNATTGAVDIWVTIPSMSHTVDTVIYMWYDDITVTTWQGNVTGTWESNFKGVWHLPDGATLTAKDSSVSANNGTLVGGANAPVAFAGQIDGAADFDGTASEISTPNTNTLAKISVSAWVKPDVTGAYQQIISQDDASTHRQWQFRKTNSETLNFIVFSDNSTLDQSTSTATLPTNAWTHVYGTWDGTTIRTYVNGQPDGTKAFSGSLNTAALPAGIGWDGSSSTFLWNGKLDEVRLSNGSGAGAVRSADWILSEYNNQSSPSTFYTIGSQTPTVVSPTITGISTVKGISTITF